MAPPTFERHHEQSVFDYGRLLLGSLITVAGGALVALLAFAGQGHPSGEAAKMLEWAVGLVGSSLVLLLASTFFAYLNQYFLAYRGEKVWLWKASISTGLVSLLLLSIGGAAGFRALQLFLSLPH